MKRWIPSRAIRRLILVVVILAIGYGLTALIVRLIGTTIDEFMWGPESPYPLPYFFLTGLFLALGFGVWLDKFFDTEILKK